MTMHNLLTMLLIQLTLHNVLSAATLPTHSDIERTFAVKPGGLLQVSVSTGDLIISTVRNNAVSVRIVGLDDESSSLKLSQNGNTVSIHYHPQLTSWSGRWNATLRFEISVPTAFNLELKSRSGEIRLLDALTGSVRASSRNGDIRLHTVQGNVDITTTTGAVFVEDVQGDGYVKTTGGNLHINKVSGNLEISTTGGTARLGTIGKRLRVQTTGSDVLVESIQGGGFLYTSGGDIRVQAATGELILSTSGGNIAVHSATGKVDAKTTGGHIRLENIKGNILAHTAAGDIYAELTPTGTSRSALSTTSGNIELRIPESAKVTIEAQVRSGHSLWAESSRLALIDAKQLTAEVSTLLQELRALTKRADRNAAKYELRLDTVLKLPMVRKGQRIDSLIRSSVVMTQIGRFASNPVVIVRIDSLLKEPVMVTQVDSLAGSPMIAIRIDSLTTHLTDKQRHLLRKAYRALERAHTARRQDSLTAADNGRSKTGYILSDFAGQRSDEGAEEELTVTLNGGGAFIRLETTQGEIRIKKLRK